MKCQNANCQQSISEDSAFCPKCGHAVSPVNEDHPASRSVGVQHEHGVRSISPPKFTPPNQKAKSLFCSSCGTENGETSTFCQRCGSQLHGVLANTPVMNDEDDRRSDSKSEVVTLTTHQAAPRSFVEAIKTCFAKYQDYNGRASRSEFWYFILFTQLILIVLTVLSSAFEMSIGASAIVNWIWNLAIFCPYVAVTTRRLHDTNRSGWNQLWGLTIVGLIPLIIWFSSKGVPAENRYG